MKKIENHSPEIDLYNTNILIKKCLKSNWISTSGKLVNDFEHKIAQFTGAKHVVACNSGSAALQVSLRLAGIEINDEVIVPTLTFVATINSIIYNQANPIFMDCDEYYNLDIKKTINFLNTCTFQKKNKCINKKTGRIIKAIILVYIWGNGIDCKKLIKICKKKNIKIIEDAAEALGTFIKKNGKYIHAGLQGFVGCISFNANKIITTGGGGAIITNNKKLANTAYYLTTQAKSDDFNFVHDDVGYNYRLSSLPAALGITQINSIKKKLIKKFKIFKLYKNKIDELKNFKIANTPLISKNNHWMNILQINFKKKNLKNKILRILIKKGIGARPIWKLNHEQKPFKKFEQFKINKAKDLFSRSICLPSGPSISEKNINYIFKVLKKIDKQIC